MSEYTKQSPLIKRSGHYTAQQLYAAFEPMTPGDQKAAARRLLDRIVVLAKELGLDEIAAAAIVWIETGAAGTGLPFRSRWWKERLNAGNLGVTGDDAQNEASQSWSTPEDAANALMAHLTAYAYGDAWRSAWDADELGDPTVIDKRFQKAIDNTPSKAGVKTLADLNRRWAIDADDDYGGKLAERANKIVAAIGDQSPPVTTPSTDPEPSPAEGDTPMALEIVNRVIGVQGNAPATKLNMGPGKTRPIIHNTDNPSKGADALMHAKFVAGGGGSGNVSFHFANDSNRAVQILPLDRIGYHASDGCDNRNTDTGCFDGIAIENCDNVDGNIDQTFENLAELLACIEFGDPRIDYGTKPKSDFVGFIDRTLGHHDVAYDQKWCPSDFMNKYGETGYKTKLKARAKQLLAIKQGGTTPVPEPVYAPAHPVSKESQIINEHVFLAPGGKTFQTQTTPREYGDPGAKATGPDIAKGTKITQDQISHYVVGTGDVPNIWLVLTGVDGVADGSRVPAEAVIAA